MPMPIILKWFAIAFRKRINNYDMVIYEPGSCLFLMFFWTPSPSIHK